MGVQLLIFGMILKSHRDVNTAVMELLIMAYALKTSCARNIIGVIPYFPYSKQSKMRKRGSIVCKLLASMLAKAGECCGHPRGAVLLSSIRCAARPVSSFLGDSFPQFVVLS